MPIYEYRCSSCGTEKEYLQKLSDAPISACPACGKAIMVKLLSAAGFQLKGTGWYATDFKSKRKPDGAGKSESGEKGEAAKSEGSGAKSESAGESAPACGAGACPACQ